MIFLNSREERVEKIRCGSIQITHLICEFFAKRIPPGRWWAGELRRNAETGRRRVGFEVRFTESVRVDVGGELD